MRNGPGSYNARPSLLPDRQQSPLENVTIGSMVGKTATSVGFMSAMGALSSSSVPWLAKLGTFGRLGIGGLAGAGIGIGVGALTGAFKWAELQKNLQREGQQYYLDKAYSTSRQRLETMNIGIRGPVAHTMRQQMLQTLHNSAYYGRQVMGREAEILHS